MLKRVFEDDEETDQSKIKAAKVYIYNKICTIKLQNSEFRSQLQNFF